jgi:heme exporter protein B
MREAGVVVVREPAPGRQFVALMRRDLVVAFRAPGELANPLMFYLMGIALFPLGVGPGPGTLGIMAAGVLWALALLATLMSMDGLFRRDFEEGTLEQLLLGSDPLFVGMLAKVTAHWLVTGLPLTLLSPVAALLLYLPGEAVPTLMVSLALGTPVLSLIGSIGAALTVALRRGGLLLALLVLPLYVPVLVLGAGAVAGVVDGVDASAQLTWLGAILALAVTLSPFATALALKVGMEQ